MFYHWWLSANKSIWLLFPELKVLFLCHSWEQIRIFSVQHPNRPFQTLNGSDEISICSLSGDHSVCWLSLVWTLVTGRGWAEDGWQWSTGGVLVLLPLPGLPGPSPPTITPLESQHQPGALESLTLSNNPTYLYFSLAANYK